MTLSPTPLSFASALLCGAAFAFAPMACAQDAPQTTAKDLSAHGATLDATDARADMMGEAADAPLAKALEARITSGAVDEEVSDEFSPGVARAVRHAYASRLFQPLWTQSGARAFRESSRDLFRHGVASEDVFERDLDDLIEARFGDADADARARADTALTVAALRAAQAVSGTLAEAGGRDLDADAPKRTVLVDYLVEAGRAGDTRGYSAQIDALAPRHPQYAGLMDAMARYRDLKRAGGWAAIPDGDLIEMGDTDARVSAIRTRLAVEGFDSPLADTPDLHDEGFDAALKAFQTRHGLKADGVVGPATLRALNESPASKIARIAESMHRWREHGDLGDRYVLANIPSYTAEGWSGGERELVMRTVVGAPRHATPAFSDTVEYVVANPKWYVPKSIARRQKLSKLQADPSYAPRKNYQVVNISTGQAVSSASVDWNAPGVLDRYRLVQQPGESNALGELKIIFPNQYSVYLHGTPTTHLFDEAQRAFSSGCVRLEDPEKMARWIAREDDKISPAEVTEQLDSGERERMYLGEQIPVHITYHTVTVNDDGQAVFHRDVYDRLEDIAMVERMAALGPSTPGTAAP